MPLELKLEAELVRLKLKLFLIKFVTILLHLNHQHVQMFVSQQKERKFMFINGKCKEEIEVLIGH